MSNVQTLRDAYDAFKAGDLPRMFTALDERIEWHVPSVLPWGGAYVDHAGVSTFLQSLAQQLAEPAVEVDAIVESGDRIVVLGHTSGVLDGARVSYPFAHAWLFAEGRAIRFTEYVDPEQLLATRV
jgi:ketosteroid isomerase-like protein